MFEPIAIVGQACVLPGALTPDAMWDIVRGGRDVIGRAPEGFWRTAHSRLLHSPQELASGREGCVTDRGGFVTGFESVFDPGGFGLDGSFIRQLDPMTQWLLYCGRQALATTSRAGARTGAVVGNLACPSASLAAYAEAFWLQTEPRPHQVNRFNAGMPAHLLARALGLDGGAYALDAACASTLYAIKIACDALHTRRADLMLAGAVNRTDGLVLHAGFQSLGAISPSGRSRPFHRDADGLLPSEGAGLFALKRLGDAEDAGDRILGVIRGVGLSNDGRTGGFLAPAAAGEVNAMRRAFAGSDLTTDDISFVECHATGTSLGDATELRSVAKVYGAHRELRIGAVKSNIGHLLTASGVAALVKTLGAMENGVIPPTIHCDLPTPALQEFEFDLVRSTEQWAEGETPRCAAINGFGFGGNNAHMIVEEWRASRRVSAWSPPSPAVAPDRIAIVGLGVQAGGDSTVEMFRQRIFNPPRAAQIERALKIEFPNQELKFPPKDLERCLPQQLMILKVALAAIEGLHLPMDSTSVLIGTQTDAEAVRHPLRLRLPDDQRDGTGTPKLNAASVIGCMFNVPANRINAQLDAKGPSFGLFAEEISGLRTVEIAMDWLARREIDAAIVGAVDMAAEPVNESAIRAVLPEQNHRGGDAACVLVLKREQDALRDGDPVIALIDTEAGAGSDIEPDHTAEQLVRQLYGHCHAASGLLELVAATVSLRDRVILPQRAGDPCQPRLPGAAPRRISIARNAIGDQSARLSLIEAAESKNGFCQAPFPVVEFYDAATPQDLALKIERREQSDAAAALNPSPPSRLVIVARPDALARKREEALTWLGEAAEDDTPPDGVFYRREPVHGKTAFVFTGGASAYPGMGRDLVLAFPELRNRLHSRFRAVDEFADWIYRAAEDEAPTDYQKLSGSSFLSQIHVEFTRGLLSLEPDAAIGLSAGETNALFAMGAWQDMDELLRGVADCRLYEQLLGGEHQAVHSFWMEQGIAATPWSTWHVTASADEVKRAIATEPAVYLLIINSPRECVIGGDRDGCLRVIATLGAHRAVDLRIPFACHCPPVRNVADLWRLLHHRPTRDTGVKIYSNAHGAAYPLDADAVADALTTQATATIDFPRTIQRAWDDGVRIFIEHGPRAECSRWIGDILAERPHLAVALDAFGRSSLDQVFHVIGELLSAGVVLDLDRFRRALPAEPTIRAAGAAALSFPAHWPPPRVAVATDSELEILEHAPPLARLSYDTAPIDWTELQFTETSSEAVMDFVSAAADGAPAVAGIEDGSVQPSLAIAAARRILDIHADVAAAHVTFQENMKRVAAEFQSFSEATLASLLAGPNGNGAAPARAIPERGRPVAAPLPPRQNQRAAPVAEPAEFLEVPPKAPAPLFDRHQLEIHASGKISSVFGPLFKEQDQFARQVRMPCPPLLLADEVNRIEGEPGSMDTGTVWTTTYVREDSWYLHHDRMPAGLVIEAGQADLLLISWLGIDLLNRGERVYRLLGCDLVFHGEMPRPGDALKYRITIERLVKHGAAHLFFFNYDCHVDGVLRLSVRNGQAGFFTDEELAQSQGILWSANTVSPRSDLQLDPPPLITEKRRFSRAEIEAFAAGRLTDCFGKAFEAAQSHTRTPNIPAGRMMLFESIDVFDPHGGPWGRGYIRGERDIQPDDWFFEGHFKNDPCLPGTLMFEASLQVMAFYMAALGLTLPRDGWRFEPIVGENLRLRCRGQATPASRRLVFEMFVEGIVSGPIPTLRADFLCSVDGHKAFHGGGMALRLVPGWPIDSPAGDAGANYFSHAALLAGALGRPSAAFGPMYARFDRHERVPRLPGPPYHFMSQVLAATVPEDGKKVGATVEAICDVPVDAWLLKEQDHGAMPFCAFLEAALQPCGWLASYAGCCLIAPEELFFRNLDGVGTVFAAVTPGTLHTHAKLTSLSVVGSMIIVAFDVTCRQHDATVFSLKTTFGFFPQSALAEQVGLPLTAADTGILEAEPNLIVDLAHSASPGAGSRLRIATGRLRMIDRVTGYWADAGEPKLGVLRAEKDVDHGEWFFKAHFFQDPVMPGSLGIESLLQALQSLMAIENLDAGFAAPQFTPIALGSECEWKFRGQVLPTSERVVVAVEVLDRSAEEGRITVTAKGTLFVDGMKIYELKRFGMQIVDAAGRNELPAPAPALQPATPEIVETETLDPAVDRWLSDHCPTYVIPVLPLMSVVDRCHGATARVWPDKKVLGLRNLQLNSWISFAKGPRTLQHRIVPGEADTSQELLLWRDARHAALSRYDLVASCSTLVGDAFSEPPSPLPPLRNAQLVHDPRHDPSLNIYDNGTMFHGPILQLVRRLSWDASGASGLLDATPGKVPHGSLNQALLDAATHTIPNQTLWQWSNEIADDQVGYPSRIPRMDFFSPAPRHGLVRCEVRFRGFSEDNARFPWFAVQLIADDRVWCTIDLVYALFPTGPLGSLSLPERKAFAADKVFVPGARIGRTIHPGETQVLPTDIAASDWLPGTVAALYEAGDVSLEDLCRVVAIKDHAAQVYEAHPSSIAIEGGTTRCADLPLRRFAVETQAMDGTVIARDGGAVEWDWDAIRSFWNADYGVSGGVLIDFYSALTQRFVRRLRVADRNFIEQIKGRPVLYLCNHQVDIESPLFNFLAPAVFGTPIQTISRTEHLQSWVGKLDRLADDYPGMNRLERILYFDRSDPAALFKVLERYREALPRENCSLMVHVEGELALTCRTPVTRLSSVFIDLALQLDLPIVPVRFIGGLPTQPLQQTIPFPIGYGQQDYVCGKPIFPDALAKQPLSERIATVVAALNAIAPANAVEVPLPGETGFVSAVEARIRAGARPRTAVVFETIARAQQSIPSLAAVHEALVKNTTPAHARVAALVSYLRRDLEQG